MKKHPLTLVAFGLALLLSPTGRATAQSILPKDGRLAIAGDSITQQKLYSTYIETYLLATAGRSDVHVFQFGWGGETAGGFDIRLKHDLATFRPNVVTLCYGMNDGNYRPYEEAIGKRYEEAMRSILKKLTADGIQVVVGTPPAVDSKYFSRSFVNQPDAAKSYNSSLATLGGIGKTLALEWRQGYADVHSAMMEAMGKAKAAYGADYDVCGQDGVHAGPNGQLAMAYAFLKSLGCEGNVAEITFDASGKTSVSPGHKVLATAPGGGVEVESERYPFCFEPDAQSSRSTRSILPHLPFNQDLNRFQLKVLNLSSAKAQVKWGEESREFTKTQLENGVNLASEFSKTPFDKVFAAVKGAVLVKQDYETQMIKGMLSQFRGFQTELQKDPEFASLYQALCKKFQSNHARLDADVRALLVPVKHTIAVTPL